MQKVVPKVIYLCDGNKECNKSSSCALNPDTKYPTCSHTLTIRNAKNGFCEKPSDHPERFEKQTYNAGDICYFEKEDFE